MVPLLQCARCGECSLWLAMEAKFMNCSGSRFSLLRLTALGFVGAFVAAGCGGSGDGGKKDGGMDAPPGVSALKITPTSQDFGSVVVGGMSAAPVTFTVTNTGVVSGTPKVDLGSTDFML